MTRATMQMAQDYLERIKELEKENAELRKNGFTVSAMTEQQLKVALEKGEQLEKENAELKAKNEELGDRLCNVANNLLDSWCKGDDPCPHLAELEKENALLKGRNEGFEQQIMGLLIKYEEVYKRFPDLKSAMDKAEEVLKENAGLKAGRPKWHKVADGDLPKEEDLVLFKTDVDYYIGKIDYSKKCWWTGVCRDESICNSFVIAWCEIPKYTEE